MKDRNHEKLCQAYWDLMQRVRSDPEYALLHSELEEWEPRYEAILADLPEEYRLTIDRYITLRENLSRRVLEYACAKILSSRAGGTAPADQVG